MRRREFLGALGGAAAWPVVARSQQPLKLLRIGTMSSNWRAGPTWAAFEQRLRELGYIEGQNLAVEFITTDHVDHIDEAAQELIGARSISFSCKTTSL